MARWLTTLAGALALLLISGPTSAQEASASSGLSRIVSSGTLRVGMSGSQPPLNFEGKDGAMQGLEVDLAHGIAGLMRVKLQIVQTPFPELLDALESGKVDLVMSGMTTTAERSLRASFVGPYFLSGKSILTRSTTLAQANKAGDLDQAELKLAALEASTSEQFVNSAIPKASLVTTADYDEAVKLLLDGKVDALVADREIVMLTAFLHPKEGLATLREPLTIEPIGMAVHAGSGALATYLDNALGALEASGFLSGLRSRWLERNDWVSELP
ncbi:MAG: transporter substrate-binding domain-containing protein [bacterium]|nr:transporter substrate-binding domain-containing protein [bacterium]